MDPVSNACDELFEGTQGSGQGSGSASRLLVAFSGGMDSTVLLHALAQSATRFGVLERVLAVHVDHGLSPDSQRWADHCASVARALSVRFQSRRCPVNAGSNLEARARSARYAAFESWLDADDTLLLAHHAGDQLESQLLHLFQGRGLYGMPASRRLGAGYLRRPLLELPRQRLAGYARQHALSWLEDPSNQDEHLDRNFLRHRLVPELDRRFDGLAGRIQLVAENLADSAAALDELGRLDRQPLPLTLFDGLSQHARLALLRRWLNRHAGEGGVSRVALDEFLNQLEAGNDRLPSLTLPGGRLVRYQRALHLVPPAPELASSYPLAVPGVLVLPHGRLTVELSENTADDGQAATISTPLEVVFAGAGQKIRSGGHSRGVRELMRAAGVPPWRRDQLPLLADADGIAVVPGVAVRDAPAEGSAGDCRQVNVRWQAEAR